MTRPNFKLQPWQQIVVHLIHADGQLLNAKYLSHTFGIAHFVIAQFAKQARVCEMARVWHLALSDEERDSYRNLAHSMALQILNLEYSPYSYNVNSYDKFEDLALSVKTSYDYNLQKGIQARRVRYVVNKRLKQCKNMAEVWELYTIYSKRNTDLADIACNTILKYIEKLEVVNE